MSVYANVAAVVSRHPYPGATSSSKPSTIDLQTWLDEAEATLNGALLAVGLTAPYGAGTDAAKILGILACDYAEGRYRMALASAGNDGGNNDGKDLIEKFNAAIVDIIDHPSAWGARLGGGSSPASASQLRSNTTNSGLSAPGRTFCRGSGNGSENF